jgi:hypothetical protein
MICSRLRAICPLALALWGCTDHKGPPIHLAVAHAATADGRCVPAGAPVGDGTVPGAGIDVVRVSFRVHTAGDRQGTFLCDRLFTPPAEPPALKVSVSGDQSIDIFAEGFKRVSDPMSAVVGDYRRVATGALTGVDLKSKSIDPLLLYLTESFGCVDSRLQRARAFHSATLLPNGQVLLVGGVTASAADETAETINNQQLFLTGSAEVYDPATGKFTTVTESAPGPRAFHQAALLNDSPPYQVLLVGGVTTADATMPTLGSPTAASAARGWSRSTPPRPSRRRCPPTLRRRSCSPTIPSPRAPRARRCRTSAPRPFWPGRRCLAAWRWRVASTGATRSTPRCR